MKTRYFWPAIIIALIGMLPYFSTPGLKAQEATDLHTQKIIRANLLNPAFAIELPTFRSSVFMAGVGVGYGGSYPDLTVGSTSGVLYDISPFLNLHHQWIYNRQNRLEKDRTVAGNSGNFVAARFFIRGPEITNNFTRISDYEFAVGPTWGLRRQWGERVHFSAEIGPVYYFDLNGNDGFFPLIPHLQLGININ